jgi:hypothetical protein
MLEHNEKNDELVRRKRRILKEIKDETNEDKKKELIKQLEETQDEIFIAEFGDRNYKRFNTF